MDPFTRTMSTQTVTTRAVNGLSLCIATALIMVASNGLVFPLCKWVPTQVRMLVFILVFATLVSIIDMSINLFIYPLNKVLGILILSIVVNSIVLARVESFAAKSEKVPSMFSGLDLVFFPTAKQFVLTVIPDNNGFILVILPLGAFLGLGSLVASAIRDFNPIALKTMSQYLY